MTVLITSDLHFSSNPRDDYRHAFMSKLSSIVERKQVELVMILGDLTEAKDQHNAELVNEIVDHISMLSKLCPVVVLKGNHDYLNDPMCPFFGFLSALPDVWWINTPTWTESLPVLNDTSAYGNGLILPYTSKYKEDWKALIASNWTDSDDRNIDLVFCHNTFQGAVGDNDRELSGVPVDVFPDDVVVLAGDVHVPQKLGPITYVGAPYTIDFGDSYQPRLLFMRKGGKLTSMNVSGPMKRLVEVDSVNELEDVDFVNRGDILKVRVSLKRADHANWSSIQAEVREWGEENGYRVHVVQPVILDGDRKRTKKIKRSVKDDKALLKEYCSLRGVDVGTISVGMGLMESS